MEIYKDKKWLLTKYEIEHLSTRDLARLSSTTATTIREWLIRYDIKLRNHTNPFFRQPINRSLSKYKNYQWLYKKYVDEGLSCKDIGNQSGISNIMIYDWLVRFNIPRRKSGSRKGKLNNRWKGGEYYSKVSGRWYLTVPTGRIVRYRYVVEQFLGRKLHRKETVHHINGDKTDDRLENLYLFSQESNHQKYHQDIIRFVLANIFEQNLDLTKATFLIKKSNLSKNG